MTPHLQSWTLDLYFFVVRLIRKIFFSCSPFFQEKTRHWQYFALATRAEVVGWFFLKELKTKKIASSEII